jgi:hypothetical protein
MMFKTIIGRSVLLAALVLSALPSVAAQGIVDDYLPFSKSKLRRFPMKRHDLPAGFRDGTPFVISGVRMREEDDESQPRPRDDTGDAVSARLLVFSGRDLDGKEWRIQTTAYIYYDAVYEADLDRNGVRDLVLTIGTGGNGLAPPTQLLFLTFDRRGRPALFAATGYFQPQPDGIFDVVDMDGDGRAELLYVVFDDGYWITNFYNMREARWNRVPALAGLRFPLYTRFTNRPNHRPVRPAPGRHPVAPDLLEENRNEAGAP